MTREDIYERLSQVFWDVFDDDSIIISDDTTAEDVDDWDSLMHITLISEIEDAFGIKFSMKDVTGMQNVGELVDKISELVG